MEITILGTGTSQGVPVIACNCDVCKSSDSKDKRLRSSISVNVDDNYVVIDTGPDFRQQMLRENIQNIDAVLYTHHHKDHVAGLDDIRAYNFRWKKKMQLYCTESVSNALQREFPYIFEEYKYPGIPKVEINIIRNKTFKIGNTSILPIEAKHYKMPVFGYRIKDFVYLTDVSYINEIEKQKMRGARVIVLDALRKEKHISHFNLEQAVGLLLELKPEKAYLTHISHLMGKYADVNKDLPSFISLAYDGQKITLDT